MSSSNAESNIVKHCFKQFTRIISKTYLMGYPTSHSAHWRDVPELFSSKETEKKQKLAKHSSDIDGYAERTSGDVII